MVREQRGAVTHMMAVVMLLICTLVTAYAMRHTVLRRYLAASSVRAEQVMAVARTGLAQGLARLADAPPLLPNAFSGTMAGQGVYRVRYTWRRETAPQVLEVISEADSTDADSPDNSGVVRVVTVRAIFTPWLADIPSLPLISRGAVRVVDRAVLDAGSQSAPLI